MQRSSRSAKHVPRKSLTAKRHQRRSLTTTTKRQVQVPLQRHAGASNNFKATQTVREHAISSPQEPVDTAVLTKPIVQSLPKISKDELKAALPPPIAENPFIARYGVPKREPIVPLSIKPFKIEQPIDAEGAVLGDRPDENILTSLQYANAIPIILVNTETAQCNGNPGAPHPQESIQVLTSTNEPVACKYCMTKFAYKPFFDKEKYPNFQEL